MRPLCFIKVPFFISPSFFPIVSQLQHQQLYAGFHANSIFSNTVSYRTFKIIQENNSIIVKKNNTVQMCTFLYIVLITFTIGTTTYPLTSSFIVVGEMGPSLVWRWEHDLWHLCTRPLWIWRHSPMLSLILIIWRHGARRCKQACGDVCVGLPLQRD